MNYAKMTKAELEKQAETVKAEIAKGKAEGLSDTGRIMRTRYGILGAVSAELVNRK